MHREIYKRYDKAIGTTLYIHECTALLALRPIFTFRVMRGLETRLTLQVQEITYHECFCYCLYSASGKSSVRELMQFRELFDYLHYEKLRFQRQVGGETKTIKLKNRK